jgi:hypothetical protein
VTPVPGSVSVAPASVTLAALGATARLTAQVRDQNGNLMAGEAVAWSSSSPAIATVDATGLVTAVADGNATITAAAGSATGTASVVVHQVPVTLSLTPDSLALEGAGDTATVLALVTDANGHEVAGASVVWASDDDSVASIDSTGLVTAIRPGSTKVTVRSDSLAASAQVQVFGISSDRDVLEYLYSKTGGDGWRDNANWLTDAPLSEWAGVTTGPSGRVRYLELRDNGLEGQIPRSLGLLDQLFRLDLSGNSLRGPIPSEIGQLQLLRDLSLNRNDLSGSLPPELGDMAGLEYLSVTRNDLSGPLPETFSRLALRSFYLYGT